MAHSFIYTSEADAAQKAESLITHPLDLEIVTNENFDPQKKANKNLTVDAARELIKSAYISPIGETKVFLLPNAELMTLNAQNALLKLIEEPPPNTIFFFATSSPKSLIPTILSRSQIINTENNKETKDSELTQTLTPLCINFAKSQSAQNRYALQFALINLKDNKQQSLKSLENIFLFTNNQNIDIVLKAKMQKNINIAKQQLKQNCNWQSIVWQLLK